MSRVLVWRSDDDGAARTRKFPVISITEDGNEPTLIGRPRGPETPICRNCGRDARYPTKLHRFSERRPDGVIASGWRCA